jgi:hypothetical protein
MKTDFIRPVDDRKQLMCFEWADPNHDAVLPRPAREYPVDEANILRQARAIGTEDSGSKIRCRKREKRPLSGRIYGVGHLDRHQEWRYFLGEPRNHPRFDESTNVRAKMTLRWLGLRRALYVTFPLDFVVHLALLFFCNPGVHELRYPKSFHLLYVDHRYFSPAPKNVRERHL